MRSIFTQRENPGLSPLAEVGLLVRAQRKRQQLTLVDAAGLCGVSVRFLSELENGRRNCSLQLLLQVCQTLGIDLFACPRGGQHE